MRGLMFMLPVLFCSGLASAQMMQGINGSGSVAGGGATLCTGAGTIARDNNSSSGGYGSGSTNTFAHTVAGSNRVMIVAPVDYQGSHTVSGVTYNGVALTKLASQVGGVESQVQDTEIWYLVAPATGAHDVVVTWSGATTFSAAGSFSYTGVNQTTPFKSSATKANNASTSNESLSTTTDGANCWLIGATYTRTGNPSAGAGTSFIVGVASDLGLWDSNAAVASGTPALAWTSAGKTWPGIIVGALAPTP